MKTQITNTLNIAKRFKFIALAALAFFIVSCDKEDPELMGRPNNKGVAAVSNPGDNFRAPAPGDASIAEIAIAAEFTELVGALAYVDDALNAGLVDLFLNGKDQYTVFAPTNDAFGGLYGALGIDGITDLPAELVLDVLLYHVTKGRRAANSVVPRRGTSTIVTLLGATFTVNTDATITAIGNTAKIETPNIPASNGIIHVIDAVILPIK